jgi:EmrB/QacA subfamily drug resistance transporter
VNRKWLPLVAVCLGTFMLLVDVTIVNVALPDMARGLHTTFAQLQWVIDIYALVLAALMLAIGSIADVIGRRFVYIVGLIVFALGSLASGVAPSGTLLIVARGVQGIGGAAMYATTIALINSSYHGRDRGMAFGIWGAVNGAAAAAGPILGGVLTAAISWRLIFFVNLPVSIVALAMSMKVLSETRPDRRPRIDFAGSATFTISAAALTYALIRVSSIGWGAMETLVVLAVALIAAIAFVAIESRIAEPMLDMRLMRNREFVGVMLGAVLLSVAAFAALTYTSLWLQSVLGLSPIPAGLVFVPLSAAALIVSASAGRFLHGSPRWAIRGGLLLIGIGSLLQSQLNAHSGWGALIAGLAVIGVGVGLATPTLASAAMGAVPHERGGMAAGAVNTARQLGYGLGIAILGTIFQARISHVVGEQHLSNSHGISLALSGGQTQPLRDALPRGGAESVIRHAFASGLETALLTAGILGLVAFALTVVLLRPQRQANEDRTADVGEREQGEQVEAVEAGLAEA